MSRDLNDSVTRPSTRHGAIVLAIVSLLLTGCFEESVTERLRLVFRADATAEVEVSIELRHDEANEPELERRLVELERAWLEGFDPWAMRFERLQPASEEFYWQKQKGRLSFASRLAVVDELRQLEELFADTAVSLAIEVTDETVDIGLYPGPSGRAGRRERRRVERLLDEWSAQIADYLEAGQALYAHLDRHPDRATVCFAELFDIEMPASGGLPVAVPSVEEERLLDTLGEAMADVFAILLETEDAETLDQLAARVYDPFPAPLAVELPVEPEQVEGFEPTEDGWSVPRLAPWAALERLGDRWLSPEPVLAYVDAARAGDEGMIDLLAFASRPRRHAPAPDAETVRAALEAELAMADVYRLVWRRRLSP